MHYKNKYLVDYSSIFGENYTKLILTNVRNQYSLIENVLDNFKYLSDEFDNIFINKKVYTLEEVIKKLEDPFMGKRLNLEGFIFKDNNSNINNLCKIRTTGYNEGLNKIPNFNDYRWNVVYSYLANNLEEVLKFKNYDVNECKIIVKHIGNVINGLVNVLSYLIVQFTKINLDEHLNNIQDISKNHVFDKRNTDKYEELFQNNNFVSYKTFISKFQKFIVMQMKNMQFKEKKLFLNDISLHVNRTLRRIQIKDIMLMLNEYEIIANKIRNIFTDPRYIFKNRYEKFVLEFILNK